MGDWSYSRANCYDNCPRCFKLTYLDKVDRADNAFASWGSLIHKCLELYFKGDISFFEIVDFYDEHYDEYVKEEFPYGNKFNLSEKYYEAGKEYLSNLNEIDDRYEVVGVEQELHIKVGDIPVIGYIDLVIRDKSDNSFIIVDHKSAGKLSGSKLSKYLIQLYIYSEYVYQTYGKYPKMLVFNLFRVGDVVTHTFSKDEFNEACKWLKDITLKTTTDKEFKDKIEILYDDKFRDLSEFKEDDYFCNFICSARRACKRSIDYEGDDVDWI